MNSGPPQPRRPVQAVDGDTQPGPAIWLKRNEVEERLAARAPLPAGALP
jgi:hypothetical protein